MNFKKSIKMLSLLAICIYFYSSTVYAYIDFSGRQSASYTLSNGKRVRIEYHGGQPHIHELDKRGNSVGSENINDDSAHHNNEGKISKDTRDIVKKGKTKSQSDKSAYNKAKDYGSEYKKVDDRSSKSTKNLIEKNKAKISKAKKSGSFFVVIGGLIYIMWWLLKLASGWGIFIPV